MNSRIRERIYKYKKYPHFDPKVNWRDVYYAVESPKYISSHSFYPFIHYTQKTKKLPEDYIAGKAANRGAPKKREIMYSCHMDRYIYEYYAYLLNSKYNERVKKDGTNKSIIAYRNNLHKNNVHFAKEVFDAIKRKKDAYIIIGDFTKYFDNMLHDHLKKMICSLLCIDFLPDDLYAVFRSITKYAYIDLDDIKAVKKVNHRDFFNLERLFSPEEFREFKKGKVLKNCENFGIPQGSAISAVLSNIYLLEFDKKINDYVTCKGGIYRRYCDDFIIILPNSDSDAFRVQKDRIIDVISNTPNLNLHPDKTRVYHYAAGCINNCNDLVFSDALPSNNLINYLGFTFDGKTITVRQKTIAKYYRRMYQKADTIVRHEGISPKGKKIPMSGIYKKYSKYGKLDNSQNSKYPRKYEGNFLSYIDRAEGVFGRDESIKRDTSQAWEKLQKRLHRQKKK